LYASKAGAGRAVCKEGLKLFRKAMQTLDNILERVVNYAIFVAGIITLLMAIATTFGVVMRYAFNRPEHYSYEIGIFCLISSVAFAIPYIQKQGRNLRVDFISNRYPPKVQDVLLNILVPLIALFYLVPLVWKSWGDAFYSLGIAERTYSAWGPPVGPMKLFVPIGAGLLCLVLIAQLIHGLLALKKR
jgi:TRAP-type C4-dicarboxylate transport system permease small subunit